MVENFWIRFEKGRAVECHAEKEQKALEELLAIGVNNAPIHCDFMYGTADMEVDGVKEDGTVIPVMRAGEFVENCS